MEDGRPLTLDTKAPDHLRLSLKAYRSPLHNLSRTLPTQRDDRIKSSSVGSNLKLKAQQETAVKTLTAVEICLLQDQAYWTILQSGRAVLKQRGGEPSHVFSVMLPQVLQMKHALRKACRSGKSAGHAQVQIDPPKRSTF